MITHHPDTQTFDVTVEGHLCYLRYDKQGNILALTSTQVPAAVGGRGIAADLVKTALDYAGNHQLKIRPVCSYVVTYLKRHPEYQALVANI
ncbi:MAG: N-acetyltransferase [Burkholderiales bacterium]|jgi:predicted GNAT family acetyltransferase|nr:N-acetyltransferase [Microcystis sp. M020S1]MCA3159877.1 N-acetyltransferase [Burkholderiales bacterium]MCA3161930.1 N-acetyltransferase [Burkholderiales bacterium]MCA3163039.1 N-acetyltransferase [Burkholderiales bacterium]MCA3165032.1 N-acetyltransferase [Burkholderiales bacterium]